MSFAFIGMMILLGFLKTTAFVLHPSNEEPAAPAISSRCKDESLQSIRKGLLRALNLQAEPQLPAGGIDSVREQWQRTIAATDYSVSHDSGNRTGLTCCSVASEVSMEDLGWDSWVIHPLSLTFVQCALCNPADGTAQCPSSSSGVQGASSLDPLPCCHPAVQETLNMVYMDETATIIISPIEVNRSCGCGPGNGPQPSTE
uniref:Growth/differentiation factor 7-like n=1 Tax=Poecilia reticulata TaxID=8081 RepID=A0A3P9N646_POERE